MPSQKKFFVIDSCANSRDCTLGVKRPSLQMYLATVAGVDPRLGSKLFKRWVHFVHLDQLLSYC